MELYDGDDTTVFASDWPHHDFDHPMKLDMVPLSAEQRAKVFGENALALFGIDRDGRRDASLTSPRARTAIVSVDGREVGVFNIGGRLYGLLNRCAHQGGPLCAAAADHRARSWPTPRAAGGRAGRSRARSSPARGTGSSTTCRPAAASRTREIVLRRYDVVVEGDDVVVSPASSRRPPAASGP